MRSAKTGFTLIEVIVALAICSGALLILASVANESLRRNLRARQSALVDQACQNKLAEFSCGAESAREGDLAGLPGWRWKVDLEPAPLDEVSGLERVILRARPSDGSGAGRNMSVLRYRSEKRR